MSLGRPKASRGSWHDVDLVAGFCPTGSNQYDFQLLDSDDGSVPFDARTGLIEVAASGFGFALLKRTVLQRMIETYPDTKITRGPAAANTPPDAQPWLYNLFGAQMEDGELVDGDAAFCRRWRALGGKVWMNPGVKLVRSGTGFHIGDPLTMFAPVPEMAA